MVDNEETGRKVKNRENNIQAVPDEEAQRKAVRIAVGDMMFSVQSYILDNVSR